MSVRKRTGDKVINKQQSVMDIVSKALKPEADWEDKDEFLDVIYWMKQILGVILGIIWGIVPLKGIVGILLFLLINTVIVYLYFSSFQRVDEEEYGGMTELIKEGLMTSFTSFLVSWVILYSAIHFD